MQAKGFFASLFDYSFSSFITPRIIKILYVLTTIVLALWTLAIVFVAFRSSSALGILTLVIFGPLYFVIAMIYARVLLELLIVFFRIHSDVEEINRRSGGAGGALVEPVPSPTPANPTSAAAAEPTPEAPAN
jgi:Domain of unknown function (DUF4282)